MTQIPTSIDQVTADWVAEATGLDVTGVEHEIIGVGVGVAAAVYRLRLEGDHVPDTLVIKLQALDEAAVFTASMLRMYEREVQFFDELAGRAPVHVPRSFGGAVADDGASYYLIMEDMGGHRVVDQNEGMTPEDAERSVRELARWHAEFWGDADQFVASGAAMSIGDDINHAVIPAVFGEGWEKVQAEMDIHPTIADVAPRWVAKLPDMLNALATSPTTVIHGDYRADNIFFDADDNVVLLDFQLSGLATGAYDLAYFITQSLLPEVAAEHERVLFDRYLAGLIEAGIPEAETARLWEDYRIAALFCLAYPIMASRGMDLSDPRQLQLLTTMTNGCARAIDALDLRALL